MTERERPRDDGYYWIRVKDDLFESEKCPWEPARYTFNAAAGQTWWEPDEWEVCGSEVPVSEDDLLEIGSQLTRELNETF
jgi:hypothetical protein